MDSRPVVSHKLVLLGDTSVGKSCLVVRFCRGEFFDYQEPTIGGEPPVRMQPPRARPLFQGTLRERHPQRLPPSAVQLLS